MAEQNPTTPNTKPTVETNSGFSDFLKQGLDPLRPIADKGFKEDAKKHDPSQSRILDAAKYRPYIEDLNPDDPNLDEKRADGQSGIEQAANAVGQFGAQFLGGAAMALGTSLDVEQSINTIRGVEDEYSNLLFDFGKKVIESGRESMPIYQKTPGAVNPSDSGWWAQMFADTGLSAGIMGEAMAETAAISFLTEGTGLGAEIASTAKKLRNIEGLKALIGAGDSASKLRNAATTFGVINRHHEGIMEAADAFETEYNDLKKKGFSEDDAKKGASQSASATYVGNLPLMALDILQFRAMTFNPISGGSAGGIVENLLSKIPNGKVAKGIGHAFGIASESGEEFWQALVQDEAKNYADTTAGVGSGKNFKERFKEFTDKGDTWNATIAGAFGGAVLGGASHLFQKATESGSRKQLNREYDDFVRNISGIGAEMANNIRTFEDQGNEVGANNLRRSMGIQKALHSVHLDNLKDSDTAFTSYMGYMQGVLDAANSGDSEQLKSLGLEGQEDFIKSQVPNYIKDATEIQSIYDDTKINNDRSAVIPITYRKFLQNNLASESQSLSGQIAATQASMPDIANVSNPAREIQEATINIKLAESHIKDIEKQLKNDSLSQPERDGLISGLNNLNFLIEKNTQIVEEQKEAAAALPAQQKEIDAQILASVGQNVQLSNLQRQKVDVDTQLARVRKELNTWSDSDFQTKNEREKLYDVINKASSLEELDTAEKTITRRGILTDGIRTTLSKKRRELAAELNTQALTNNAPIAAETQQPASPMSEFLTQQTSPSRIPDPVATNPFGTIEGVSDEEMEAIISADRQETANQLFSIQSEPVAIDDVEVTESVVQSETLTRTPDISVISEVSARATIVDDQTLFDPAPLSDNISDSQKEGIKNRLAEYYTSLARDLGRNPTFKELVEDMINNTSAEQVDRNFNLIKLGWTLNDYADTNFDKVYNELFGSRKSKANDFFTFAEESLATEEQFRDEQEELTEQEKINSAPAIQIEETETGEKVYKSINKFQTVESTLKFAHLSQTYNETISQDGNTVTVDRQTNTDDLNQNEFVDSRELMNPNLYQPGTVLTVRVPLETDNILLTNWSGDYQKKSAQTYGEWVAGRDMNSDEVIGRLPMIIYNGTKPVAFIHDVEWYNPINIGFGEDPAKQMDIIKASKAELLAFRKAVTENGELNITITEKRPGTKIVIPQGKPLITVAEANPQAMIGYPNDSGNLVVGTTVIKKENLMNANELEVGHKYDIRQSGVMPNGDKQYFAAKVHYSVLDVAAKQSVVQALRVYMSQFDSKQELSQSEEINNLRNKVKTESKLDLFDQADLEAYLNMFIQTYKGQEKTNKGIANYFESNPDIVNGTPYMAISEGRLVFGIKGLKMSQSEANGFTLYMHPQNLTKENSGVFASMAVSNLKRIFANDYLGAMKQNLGQQALNNNIPVSLLDESSRDQPAVPYQDYVKTKFKTNLRSIKLEDGTYTSFTQPVIHFTYENQPKSVNNEGAEVVPTIEVTPTPEVQTQPEGGINESELISSITDSLADFENLGLSPEAMQALRNLTTDSNISFDPDYARLTDDIVMSVKKKLTKVEDLDTIDRNTVVQYIANQVMTKINPQLRNTISKKELIGEINKSFNDIVAPKIALVNAKIDALQALHDTGKYPDLGQVIDQFKNLKGNAEVLKKNWNFLINEAFTDYIEKFTGISVTMSRDQNTVDVAINDEDAAKDLTEQEEDQQEFSIESSDQREKDYTKESIEDNGKNSVSYLVKRFLAQIPNYDNSGTPKKGYMGITTYPGFDYYYGLIGSILSSPSKVDSNFESVIIRLQQHADSKPWITEVIKRLNESDEQLKNAFLYAFSRETLSMKFVMYSHDIKTGAYKLKVYDTNANEILRVIQTQWRENFKQSELSVLTGENYSINVVKAQQLLNNFNQWTEKGPLPTAEQAQTWLSAFGLELSTDSMKELYTNGYYITENKKPVQYPYSAMFRKSANTNGVFGMMANYLEAMVRPGMNLDFQENTTVNPFDDTSGIMNKLALIESKYSLNVTTNSFRDGSKSIFGFTPSKYATSFVERLKNDPKLIENKRKISFDQNSFLLDLLENDPDFVSKFGIDHLGINAFKELGKKLYQDNEINSLADADHELVKLGMFQDNQQGEIKSTTFNGLKLRVGRMFLPTMSDKKTMLDISTAVLDLKTKHFEFASDGSVTIESDVKDFIFNQTIEPELKRIIAHHRRAKELGVNPNQLNNQKGYNMAAQIFNLFPAMNNIMFKGANGDVRLIEYLADSAGLINDTNYTALKENIKEETNGLIDRFFNKAMGDKMSSWSDNGYLTYDSSGNISEVKYLNGSYLNAIQGDKQTQIKVAALDFTINSAINNANLHMLFAGDIANYSQDKAFKNNVIDGKPYLPVNNEVYTNMSADVISVNLGKRLAMLIAPGNTVSQSKNDKYIQLFLKDRVSQAENIEFLIKLYYGSSALAEVQSDINTLKATNDSKSATDIRATLMDKFPDLDAYFAIESTDAQEYTTAKEHLDILYRQGRVSVAQYQDFVGKITRQRTAEEKGLSISPEDILSDKDLKTIFQPIKPVYTGQINDVRNDVSRMVYIKSSSFPLLPQMTSAFPGLDGLRKKLEEIQSASGKNVRASYDTANKVGAVLGKNQLQVWDEQGNFIEDSINVNDIVTKLNNGDDTSALYLDRDFFRIQQDVPFKSTKIDHQDTITLGTQMMKLMFGDGVGQIDDKIFNIGSKKMSGRELQSHYNMMFNNWIGSEKTKLYSSLGINESTGQAIDKSKTVQKLQNILQDEARKRGYPKQDVEALELDSNGDLDSSIQFTIPLWLSPNSNRYEALLNAIVSNRLLNLTLPGASFVAGSEEGYKVSTDLASIDQSNIVFTSKWSGELKGASDTNLAQVLMPSKFRDSNGKLLDLLSKDESGNYIYVSQSDNGAYQLKTEMVDQQLLENSTFRIPSSSHVSFAEVEVVGFLPTESGDLIIVPKNFTKQKGLDFDVDKENVYMLHHMLDDNGRLKPVDGEEYGVDAIGIAEEIKSSEQYLESLRERSTENRELIQNYEDELAVTENYDKKHVKALIQELKQDVSKADIKGAVTLVKDLKDLQSKLYQNEIIKVYSAVLGSKDERIQKKINKVLSTDFAESQANLISGMINQSVDNSNFSILSDEFQKFKMSLGAAGKLGIGVYSNYVVFHSLAQQQESAPITLTELVFIDGKSKRMPFILNIGGVEFDGKLGKIMTLDGGRSITDVNAERQNTATDNEKLQIMGKTNVNEVTINVDALLSIMGFDKSTATVNGQVQEVNIPYLLLSQPVIRDYVTEIRRTRSNIAGYNPNAEADVYEKLAKKYKFDPNTKEDFDRTQRELMTGQNLVDAILDNGANSQRQQAVLDLFLQLKDFGEQMSGVQSKLNIQRSGLGKSVFEMMEKYNNVRKMASNASIKNAEYLVGYYLTETDYNSAMKDDLIAEGYVIFDEDKSELPFAVKPRTVNGSLMIHAAKAGYQLWADYFPHQNPAVSATVNNVMKSISNEETSETKKIQLQHEVFEEMKKYLYSSNQTGIFKGDPQIERQRLFFDKEGNQSLASYLREAVKSDHPSKDMLSTNKLISRFTYTLEKGSLPSLIKFNNSQSEDFNEEYKYLALVELMDKNVPLADYNGQPYTSRMLAKDLIIYSYVQGGIQQAIEFVKYIPVPYLKEMGFADATQKWQRAANGEVFSTANGDVIDLWGAMLGYSIQTDDVPVVGRFEMQFIQHNPQRLTKLDPSLITNPVYDLSKMEAGKSPSLKEVVSFQPKQERSEIKPFISIYNKSIEKGKPKFQIYRFDGKQYNRISTLGVFGLSEYSNKSNDVVSLVDTHYPQSTVVGKIDNVPQEPKIQQEFYSLSENNLQKSLEQVAADSVPGVSQIAKVLLPYINNSIEVKIGTVNGGSSRASFQGNTITLDSGYINRSTTSKDMVAKTLLHEYIHSLTSNVLNQHFDRAGNQISDTVPTNIARLQRLFNETQKALGPELDIFKEWYAKNPGQVRSDADRILYAGMDIHEFTAMIMSEPDVQRRMSEISYMKTDRNLLEQLVEAIKKVLVDLGINIDANSITSEAMSTVFEILEDQKPVQLNAESSGTFTSFGMAINPSENDQKLNDLLDDDIREEDSDFLEPATLQENNLDEDCIF